MTWPIQALGAAILVSAFVPGPRAFDLIRDGKPACTIVLPSPSTTLEQQGAETLAHYLKLSTGVDLPIANEDQKVEGPVLSFGPTRLAHLNGIRVKGLKWDGYRMVVKNGALYLLGRDEKQLDGTGAQGSRRVALAFLERLGFRWLQPTRMGTYVPKMISVSVPDSLDVTYEPPLMYMYCYRMSGLGDWSLANGFRDGVTIDRGPHTWVKAVPASLYHTHPEYFLMHDGKRIRPTKEPNPEYSLDYNPQYCPSNPDVRRLIADWIIGRIHEGYDVVTLGQADGFVPCQCPLCVKLSPEEQVEEAEGKIIELVRETRANGLIQILLYGPTEAPPETFRRYQVGTVGLVALTGGLLKRFGSSDAALDYWRNALPAGITVFSYAIDLHTAAGLTPHFTPRRAATLMRDWMAHGAKGVFWDTGGQNWGAEGPAYYVVGRMAQDPRIDGQKAYEEYVNLTFGKAAPAMRDYYDTLYTRLDECRDAETGAPLPAYRTPSDYFVGVYSADLLLHLRAALDRAKAVAAGDDRAMGWIRLAEISYNQFALIARAFHHYQTYLLSPTEENRNQVLAAVKAYEDWADPATILPRDKDFVRNFFPNTGYWAVPQLRTNYGSLTCPPFEGLQSAHAAQESRGRGR